LKGNILRIEINDLGSQPVILCQERCEGGEKEKRKNQEESRNAAHEMVREVREVSLKIEPSQAISPTICQIPVTTEE
jgi:hypothetical protein